MDIYDAVNPLYICSKLFGLCPYGFNNEKNNRKYVHSAYNVYYSCFVLTVFLVFHYWVTGKRTSFVELKFNSITGIADTAHIYGITVVLTFIFVYNYAKKENIKEALNALHLVDQTLLEFGCVLPHKLTKFYVALFLCLEMLTIIFVENLNCYLFISGVITSYSIICNFLCGLALIILTLEEFQFFVYFFLLQYRFKILNLLLTNKLPLGKNGYEKINPETIPNCDKKAIVKLRSLHLQLCFAGKLLNEYFSIQILLLIGFAFVGFTTNAYYSFDVISDNFINNNGSFDVMPSTIIWTVGKFTELLLISVISTLTKSEVNLTGEILYQLKSKFKKDIATELHLFGKQIMHCDFKITAFDFFDIDMTLFYGVLGSAATYLTILIQFEIALKKPKNYDFTADNNTTDDNFDSL